MARTKLVVKEFIIKEELTFGKLIEFVIMLKKLRVDREIETIKLKKILGEFKNVQVKHRGTVVRKMTVRCKSIFPAEKRQCK